jgi:hypothetical protein
VPVPQATEQLLQLPTEGVQAEAETLTVALAIFDTPVLCAVTVIEGVYVPADEYVQVNFSPLIFVGAEPPTPQL